MRARLPIVFSLVAGTCISTAIAGPRKQVRVLLQDNTSLPVPGGTETVAINWAHSQDITTPCIGSSGWVGFLGTYTSGTVTGAWRISPAGGTPEHLVSTGDSFVYDSTTYTVSSIVSSPLLDATGRAIVPVKVTDGVSTSDALISDIPTKGTLSILALQGVSELISPDITELDEVLDAFLSTSAALEQQPSRRFAFSPSGKVVFAELDNAWAKIIFIEPSAPSILRRVLEADDLIQSMPDVYLGNGSGSGGPWAVSMINPATDTIYSVGTDTSASKLTSGDGSTTLTLAAAYPVPRIGFICDQAGRVVSYTPSNLGLYETVGTTMPDLIAEWNGTLTASGTSYEVIALDTRSLSSTDYSLGSVANATTPIPGISNISNPNANITIFPAFATEGGASPELVGLFLYDGTNYHTLALQGELVNPSGSTEFVDPQATYAVNANGNAVFQSGRSPLYFSPLMGDVITSDDTMLLSDKSAYRVLLLDANAPITMLDPTPEARFIDPLGLAGTQELIDIYYTSLQTSTATSQYTWFNDRSEAVVGLRLRPSGTSDDPITYLSIVAGWTCAADFNGDSIYDTGDNTAFTAAFLAGDIRCDFNGDGVLDTADISAFAAEALAGCP